MEINYIKKLLKILIISLFAIFYTYQKTMILRANYDIEKSKKKLLTLIDQNQDLLYNLTKEEKETIFSKMWLTKQRKQISVSADEMLALYEAKKTKALADNPTAEIPPYISIGASLKNEIIQKKIMSVLLKDINITIFDDNNESMEMIDSNKSLEKLDRISEIKGK